MMQDGKSELELSMGVEVTSIALLLHLRPTPHPSAPRSCDKLMIPTDLYPIL
jgi:hypothetical protein